MASRARSPGSLAAPAAGGRLLRLWLGLVTHRRHFDAASQRSHAGEPPGERVWGSGAPPHEARHRHAAAEELPPPLERSCVTRQRSHAA
eukprot:CAMPEP_0185292554 /NCGR_PEP_ID=MMETSP1363-20130426/6169_1 /TAXON_ID=38817 /ORGANISM="Gephyrocapsa oceanica, Strain RCC1303" /LENGTH=88 /DNA_ID=CAMNT_0027888815 /DNA_START=107 /DNA_END=373 /DNA_ORIENTATION=-